jgi:hypothetical protein
MLINGKTYSGYNLIAKDGVIVINDKPEEYEEIFLDDNKFTIIITVDENVSEIKTNGNVILEGDCKKINTVRNVYLNGTSKNINSYNIMFGNKKDDTNKYPTFNVSIRGNPYNIITKGNATINGNCDTINAESVLIDDKYSKQDIVVNGIEQKYH